MNLTATSPSYTVGERVTVIYDRHDPSRIRTPREQNEPQSVVWPIIIGLVGGLGLLISGWVMLVRASGWKRVLESAAWVAYESAYVRHGGRSGFVVTPSGGSLASQIALRLKPLSRWRAGRLARAAPSNVWIAGDPQFDVVIGLPGTRELFGASPPRGRAGKGFINALQSGKLPGVTPRNP